MKIPYTAIPQTYIESKKVFENKTTVEDAIKRLHANQYINKNSAKDYINYFKYLMTGSGSCRSLNKFTQEFYLKSIYEDYGKEQLKKSLVAFMKLIVKFEDKKVGSKKSMRAIYEKYNQLV